MDCLLLYRWTIAQGLFEDAQCIQGAILNSARWLLVSISGKWISSSHWFVNLLIILHAKFGELNRSINETSLSENKPGLPSQVQPLIISILPIIWLSVLSPMITKTPRTIMDKIGSQHTSAVIYANWPRGFKRPQPDTQNRKKYIKEYVSGVSHLWNILTGAIGKIWHHYEA